MSLYIYTDTFSMICINKPESLDHVDMFNFCIMCVQPCGKFGWPVWLEGMS